MAYEQPPPTPNDLMRKLIAETQANGRTLHLISRHVRSIQVMIGVWFILTLPAAIIIALCYAFYVVIAGATLSR